MSLNQPKEKNGERSYMGSNRGNVNSRTSYTNGKTEGRRII
jgi:hypothetical protein